MPDARTGQPGTRERRVRVPHDGTAERGHAAGPTPPSRSTSARQGPDTRNGGRAPLDGVVPRRPFPLGPTYRTVVSEGDSIHHLARRLRPALLGSPIEGVWNPGPRTRGRRWDRLLRGATVQAVTARGKHLLIAFDRPLVLHSHLGMSGAWVICEHGESWPRSPSTAWVVLRRGGRDVAQFGGPFLQLRERHRVAADPGLRRLGPDLCVAAEVDVPRIVRRLRDDDQSRPVGDALLDQRTMAGVGNVWKVEVCWALGIHPLLPLEAVDAADLAAIVRWIAPRIQRCGRLGTHLRPREIYGRGGRPCPACGRRIQERGSGENNRRTFWCPGCQPWPTSQRPPWAAGVPVAPPRGVAAGAPRERRSA